MARTAVRRLLASVFVFGTLLTACDTPAPTAPLDGNGFRLAASFTPSGPGTVDCLGVGGYTVTVAVKGSDRQPAANAVVTAVDPKVIGGDRCWGTTDGNGVIVFNNLQGLQGTRFFTVRTEISSDVPYLEIVPPAPVNTLQTLNFAHDPTGTRNAAMLIGGSRCTDVAFSWPNLKSVVETPCTLAEINRTLAVVLPAPTNTLYPVFRYLDGTPMPGVKVAALSAAAFQSGSFKESDVTLWCGYFEDFVDPDECNATLSHGPAFIQAMTVTDANGKPSQGLAVGKGTVVIEAVAPLEGAALFGTIVLAQGSNPTSLVLEPGICKVTEKTDVIDPEANPPVDMKSMVFGVGLSLNQSDGPGDLVSATLLGVPTTLLVKLTVNLNGAGGTGEVAYSIRTTSGNNSAKALFQVTPEACSVTGFSGLTGTLDGAIGQGYCRNDGGNVYTLVFEIYDLPELAEATFNIKTTGDNFDTSRKKLTSASWPFDLTADTCPLQLNTDGRLIGIT
jgi:hypothetical protein